MRRLIGEKIIEFYMNGGIESIPFSLRVFWGIPVLAGILLIIGYWLSLVISEVKEDRIRFPRYIATVVFWAVIILELAYVFKAQSDYILFAKILFIIPLVFIIIGSYWATRAIGNSLLEIRKYKIPAAKEAELLENPIVQKTIELALQINAVAIVCDTDCVKIYGPGSKTSLPDRVFTTEPWHKFENLKDGKYYKNEHFIPLLKRDFRISTTAESVVKYSQYDYPDMKYLNQLCRLAEVVKRKLQQDYVVLEHRGELSWDATDESYYTSGYTVTDSKVVENVKTSISGNRGTVEDFYVSIVRKSISKEVIANRSKKHKEVKTPAPKNKW